MTATKLVVCASGIYTCYLYYGVLQESIYKYESADGSHFKSTLFLLLCQCVVNMCVALVGSLATRSWSGRPPAAPFAGVSAAYVGAMLCSNEALKMVSYPTQALAKSCKMVPVMLMGVLLRGKRYSAREYFCVGLITAGIVIFRLAGRKAGAAAAADEESANMGLALLFCSLTLDGVVGPRQEILVEKYNPGVYVMMLYNNVWAVAYMAAACVATGQLHEGLEFVLANPVLGWDLALFAACSALGQSFIFLTIQTFSSLVCTTITTTRKFFTILLSVLWVGNPLSTEQWTGVGLVFVALGWELVAKFQRHRASQKSKGA